MQIINRGLLEAHELLFLPEKLLAIHYETMQFGLIKFYFIENCTTLIPKLLLTTSPDKLILEELEIGISFQLVKLKDALTNRKENLSYLWAPRCYA